MSITLNVSGKIFKVSRDVLCRSELFNGMLADCEIDNEIVISRSAKLFEHIYAYLVDDKYPYPQKYHSELDYYLIPYEFDSLYNANKEIKADISQLMKNQCNVMQEIMVLTLTRETEHRKCMHDNCDMEPYEGHLLCWRHHEQCCYSDNCYNTCDKRIKVNQAYCDKHVLHYFKV
uniref:BTB domain-containing protein n=1 Tax=viral metagenome TaxID=1070528 RepID=A0A6C0C6E4_9ZZZZ